jgi:hypothetical protein
MARLLIAQGSDPIWFGLDEQGNMIDEHGESTDDEPADTTIDNQEPSQA